jgi:hypothetical protein
MLAIHRMAIISPTPAAFHTRLISQAMPDMMNRRNRISSTMPP